MYAFKEVRNTDNSDSILVKIPKELKNKKIEIILLPTDTDIELESKKNIEQDLLFDQIKIDTRKWKFNRNEIYE